MFVNIIGFHNFFPDPESGLFEVRGKKIILLVLMLHSFFLFQRDNCLVWSSLG